LKKKPDIHFSTRKKFKKLILSQKDNLSPYRTKLYHFYLSEFYYPTITLQVKIILSNHLQFVKFVFLFLRPFAAALLSLFTFFDFSFSLSLSHSLSMPRILDQFQNIFSTTTTSPLPVFQGHFKENHKSLMFFTNVIALNTSSFFNDNLQITSNRLV